MQFPAFFLTVPSTLLQNSTNYPLRIPRKRQIISLTLTMYYITKRDGEWWYILWILNLGTRWTFAGLLGKRIERISNFSQRESRLFWIEEAKAMVRQKKQVTLQWLQDPSEINGDNLNNVR
jgi:hypothetical protein